ncbi:MAG: phage tail protein, partial [Candidatus Mariimomonas ferrooxydans]
MEGLDKAMKQLDPKIVKKATVKTINDLASGIKTQSAKEIGERYNLPAKRIKQGIKIIAKATQSNLRAILSFTGKPPGLQHYKAKMAQARRLKKGYRPGSVSVEVIKGRRKQVKGGFMMAGKTGIFRREAKSRLHTTSTITH